MVFGGVIKSGPTVVISLSFEVSSHGFDQVLGVGPENDSAGLSQRLEPASGGDDFGALVSALTDEFSNGSAVAAVIENCGRSRAGLGLPVSEAGAVDGDR